MAFRPDIVAGKAVIVVSIQDDIDKSLRRMRRSLRLFSNTLSSLGGDLFRGGAVGSFAAFFPVKDFMEFQDQMLFMQTKLQSTDRQTAELEKTIRTLGKSTSFTSQEVAAAATELAKAGFSMKEITDTLQSTLDLARSGQVELETATTILANTMRTFGADTQEAEQFASKFITAARLGTLDIIDLKESLKESSGTFRTLNVDLDRALSLITQLSLSSLKATKAGTSLNTAMINLARRAEEFEAFSGINLSDDMLSDPLQILTVLQEGLKDMSKAQQLAFLNQQTNIRGARAITGILIQGLDDQQAILNQIVSSSGEARRSAEKLDSRLGGVFRRTRSAFQEMMLSIGGTGEGPLTKIGEVLIPLLNNLSELAQTNPEVVQTMLLIPPAALAVGASFLIASSAIGHFAGLITPLLSLNGMLFESLGFLVEQNRKVAKSFITLTKSMGVPKLISGVGMKNFGSSILAGFSSFLAKFRQQRAELTTLTRVTQDDVADRFNPTRGISGTLSPGDLPTTGNFRTSSLAGGATQLGLDLRDNVATQMQFAFEDAPKAAARQMSLDFSAVDKKVAAQGRTAFASAIDDAVRAATTLIGSQGAARRDPRRADRVANAIADAMGAQGIPEQLAPMIQEKVEEALGRVKPGTGTAAQKMFDFGDVPKAAATQLKLDLSDSPEIRKPAQQLGFAFVDNVEKGVKSAPKGRAANAMRRALQEDMADIRKRGAALSRPAGLAPGLGKALSGSGAGIARGMRSLVSAIKTGGFWTRVGSAINSVGKGLGMMLRAGRGIARFTFSLSGLTTILEALILFGPSIPPIARALDALGNAFKALFSGIGDAFRNAKPAFDAFIFGIKQIATGNIQVGITFMKQGFSQVAEVIKTNLAVAWDNFIAEIEPGVRVIKGVFTGIMTTIEAVIQGIKAIIGNAWETGEIVVRGDGDFMETMKSFFSMKNMRVLFEGMISAIGFVSNTMIKLTEITGILNLTILELIKAIRDIATGGLYGQGIAERTLEMGDGSIVLPPDYNLPGLGESSPIFEGFGDKLDEIMAASAASQDENTAALQELSDKLAALTNPPPSDDAANAAAAEEANSMSSALGAAAGFTGSIQSGFQGLSDFIANPLGGGSGEFAGGLLRDLRNSIDPNFQGTMTAQEAVDIAEGTLRDVRADLAQTYGGVANVQEAMPGTWAQMQRASQIMPMFAEQNDLAGLRSYVREFLVGRNNTTEDLIPSAQGMAGMLTPQGEATADLFAGLGNMAGEALFQGMNAVTGGIADSIVSTIGNSEDAKAKQDQIRLAELATRSVVGSFASTRGGLLSVTETMDKSRNKHLETIATNTGKMAEELGENATPFVFGG